MKTRHWGLLSVLSDLVSLVPPETFTKLYISKRNEALTLHSITLSSKDKRLFNFDTTALSLEFSSHEWVELALSFVVESRS